MVKRADWDEVRSRERYIIKEIDPIKLLTILKRAGVLTQLDCESITAADKNYGHTHATQTEFLVRLKKRGSQAFSKFIVALREVGLSHVAQLLDPKFKVTATISNSTRDERVLEAGVSADIRVKIILSEPTEAQIKEVQRFRDRYEISHSEGVIKLRKYFSDLLDEDIRQHVNFVKTTSTNENPLILIFRMSNLDVAKTFWSNFNDGDIKSSITTRLQSFPDDEENCFRNEDIRFDIEIDPEDFQKVCHTLASTEECKVLVDGMEKQELKLRDYQMDLVRPALEGKNTVICAPTGSGKTFVAMEAIKHHVASPDRKYVAFIVNTVSLVEQQESRLDRYLPESVAVSSVCGSNPDTSLPSVIEGADVVVLTAQVLLNALKKKKEESSTGEKELSISQFSLLVFDECHHTTKDHPYNEIMRCYMKQKLKVASSDLPQIIGLSASLGIGTGNSGCGSKAKQYIMGLCANLDVCELQVYWGEQNSTTKITPISSECANTFRKTVDGVMAEIEKIIYSSASKPNHLHGSQPYENWVVEQSKKELDRDILTCLEHLNFYNSSLMINDQIRSEDALRYLKENMQTKDLTKMEVKLQELFDKAVSVVQESLKASEPNPGLQVLEKSLLEKFSADDHDSKGIIFVGTRFVAEALVSWLENSQSLQKFVKNPTKVIGCGQQTGKAGMSKAKQDLEIKKFREGDCNVIVATSVLLEGIDVPKCNFAINYGMPGNEITLMQARGRVRKNTEPDDWHYVIIVSHEQVMIKERDLRKEKLMEETIAKVKNMTKEDFKRQVEKLQKEAYESHLASLAKQGSNKALPVPDDMAFHCKKCKTFACKAKHIKLFHDTCRIVPNYQENLHNVTFKDASESNSKYMPGGFNKTGKTYCRNCRQDWGNRAKNEFGEFPLIKISSFRVKSSKISAVYTKWKDFPYALETFDPENDVVCEQAAEDNVREDVEQ